MMRIKLVGITDRGIPSRERLHLSVFAPSNLINYVVFGTRKVSANTVKTPPDFAYWFADMPVYPGDQIVLYTGTGQNNVERRTDGSWNRFVFWGLASPIWAAPESCAVLLEINEWDTKT
jgi:hypothetical protein